MWFEDRNLTLRRQLKSVSNFLKANVLWGISRWNTLGSEAIVWTDDEAMIRTLIWRIATPRLVKGRPERNLLFNSGLDTSVTPKETGETESCFVKKHYFSSSRYGTTGYFSRDKFGSNSRSGGGNAYMKKVWDVGKCTCLCSHTIYTIWMMNMGKAQRITCVFKDHKIIVQPINLKKYHP